MSLWQLIWWSIKMPVQTPRRERVYVLVKAYPQPSQQYDETVCCAGISEDGERFLRLYPIPYRQLPPESRFGRFDLIEVDVFGADDFRPESCKVRSDTIKILKKGDDLPKREKVKLWMRFVSPSLADLEAENRASHKSLGIIRPDPETIRFIRKSASKTSSDDQEIAESIRKQTSLFENSFQPLPRPEYAFI